MSSNPNPNIPANFQNLFLSINNTLHSDLYPSTTQTTTQIITNLGNDKNAIKNFRNSVNNAMPSIPASYENSPTQKAIANVLTAMAATIGVQIDLLNTLGTTVTIEDITSDLGVAIGYTYAAMNDIYAAWPSSGGIGSYVLSPHTYPGLKGALQNLMLLQNQLTIGQVTPSPTNTINQYIQAAISGLAVSIQSLASTAPSVTMHARRGF